MLDSCSNGLIVPFSSLAEEDVGSRDKSEDASDHKITNCDRICAPVSSQHQCSAAKKYGDHHRLNQKGFSFVCAKIQRLAENNMVHDRGQQQQRECPGW